MRSEAQGGLTRRFAATRRENRPHTKPRRQRDRARWGGLAETAGKGGGWSRTSGHAEPRADAQFSPYFHLPPGTVVIPVDQFVPPRLNRILGASDERLAKLVEEPLVIVAVLAVLAVP